eukprot:gene3449-6098_t
MSFVITMDDANVEEKQTSCFFEESLSNLPSKTKDKIKFSILNKEEIHLRKEKKDENQIISSEEISTKKIQIVKIEIPKSEEENNFIVNSLRSYYQLWKSKLSLMIVVTSIGAYFSIAQKLDTKSLWLSLGTFLQSGSANSLNQLFEIERDKKMNRTKNRPLCLNKISKIHTILQAIFFGGLGTYILYDKTNTTTSLLGLANLFLYSFVYTPSKTMHWINTWIGTINGSIPPLMGATAAELDVLAPTSIYMFLFMYLWQIVHFMAISFKCRKDYDAAGYKMLGVSDPEACANQAIVHSALYFPLFLSLPLYTNVPSWFIVGSCALTYHYLFKPSIEFRKNINSKNAIIHANTLFWNSLKHLSILFFAQGIAYSWDNVTEKISNFGDWIKSWF